MGAPTAIVLLDEEREEYERLYYSGMTAVRLKERLAIILLADEGLNNGEISEHLPVSAHKAGRWRNRFADEGLDGLEKNLLRGGNNGGKDTQKQAQLRRKIIEKTTDEKPVGATHWNRTLNIR